MLTPDRFTGLLAPQSRSPIWHELLSVWPICTKVNLCENGQWIKRADGKLPEIRQKTPNGCSLSPKTSKVKMYPKCSQKSAKIQPKFCQNSVKMQSIYSQNSVKMQSKCSQYSAKIQSKCSQYTAKIQSKLTHFC